MTYSRILVPTDFSRSSFKAFDTVRALAKKFGSSIYLLHVVEDTPVMGFMIGLSQKQLEERLVDHAARELRKAAKRLNLKAANLLVRKGDVHKEILTVVKEKKIALIVMATQGRTGVEHILLGSVTEKIVRHAPCQVLTIKP